MINAKMKFRTRNTRPEKGLSFAEVSVTAFFVIVFAAMGVDLALLIFSASVNDAACRNAARAAAQGSDYGKALALARAALKANRTDGHFITQPAITHFEYQLFGNNPPANETPYVQVRTEVTVRLPVPIMFFGANFNGGNNLIFKQIYAYPIVKTKILMP